MVERLVYQELHHINGTTRQAYQQDQVGKGSWTSDAPCESVGGHTAVLHNGQLWTRDTIEGNKVLNATSRAAVSTFAADPPPAFAGTTGLFVSGSVLRATKAGRTLWSFTGDGGIDSAPLADVTAGVFGTALGALGLAFPPLGVLFFIVATGYTVLVVTCTYADCS